MSVTINLPDEPVDEFEVRYFTIRHDRVQKMMLRYHVNSKWDDARKAKGGANFVDDWQVFVDGFFSGRMMHWASPKTKDWTSDFETREEAVSALKNKFENCALRADDRRMDASPVST